MMQSERCRGARCLVSLTVGPLGPRQNLLLGCSGDGPTGTQMIAIIMKATNGNILKTFSQLGGSARYGRIPGDKEILPSHVELDLERENRHGKSHSKSRHHRCWIKGPRLGSAGMDPEHFNDQDLPCGGCGIWFRM